MSVVFNRLAAPSLRPSSKLQTTSHSNISSRSADDDINKQDAQSFRSSAGEDQLTMENMSRLEVDGEKGAISDSLGTRKDQHDMLRMGKSQELKVCHMSNAQERMSTHPGY